MSIPLPQPAAYTCPNCGAAVDEKVALCPHCGAAMQVAVSGASGELQRQPRGPWTFGKVLLATGLGIVALISGGVGACSAYVAVGSITAGDTGGGLLTIGIAAVFGVPAYFICRACINQLRKL